jgi:hypothetical protein
MAQKYLATNSVLTSVTGARDQPVETIFNKSSKTKFEVGRHLGIIETDI